LADSGQYVRTPEEINPPSPKKGESPLDVETEKSVVQIKPQLNISPNPTQKTTTIEWNLPDEVGIITILDLLGRKIEQQELPASSGSMNLSVISYKPALYLCVLQTNNGKVLKETFVVSR